MRFRGDCGLRFGFTTGQVTLGNVSAGVFWLSTTETTQVHLNNMGIEWDTKESIPTGWEG